MEKAAKDLVDARRFGERIERDRGGTPVPVCPYCGRDLREILWLQTPNMPTVFFCPYEDCRRLLGCQLEPPKLFVPGGRA